MVPLVVVRVAPRWLWKVAHLGTGVTLHGGGWHSWGQRCDTARGQVLHQETRKWHCSEAGGTSGDREVTLLEDRWCARGQRGGTACGPVAHGDGEVAHLGTERRCCRRAGGTSGDGEVTLLGDRWHCLGTGRRHTWRRKGGAARGQAAHGEQGGGPARAQAAPGPRGGDRARR